MKPFVIQARQQAYAEILRWGLLAIREGAFAGKSKLCEIEADHIHNLPSLLDEPNEARHHCYIGQERSYYLERLEKLGDAGYAADRKNLYEQPWKVLAALAVDELKDR
jgi:hypothetical protein